MSSKITGTAATAAATSASHACLPPLPPDTVDVDADDDGGDRSVAVGLVVVVVVVVVRLRLLPPVRALLVAVSQALRACLKCSRVGVTPADDISLRYLTACVVRRCCLSLLLGRWWWRYDAERGRTGRSVQGRSSDRGG